MHDGDNNIDVDDAGNGDNASEPPGEGAVSTVDSGSGGDAVDNAVGGGCHSFAVVEN